MNRLSIRTFLGAAAGALSILLFHQTTLQVFYWFGLAPYAGFRLAIVPPFGLPAVVNACFWAAIVGAPYGALLRRRSRYSWLTGLPLGILGMLAVWFLVMPLRGQPIAFGWQTLPLIRSAVASLIWGLGVGVLFPMLLPRPVPLGRKSRKKDEIAV